MLFCSIYFTFSFTAFVLFTLGFDEKRYVFVTYYWIHLWGWLFLSKVYLFMSLFLIFTGFIYVEKEKNTAFYLQLSLCIVMFGLCSYLIA